MVWGRGSIRSRLTLRYSVILFAGLCLFAAATRFSLQFWLYSDLDSALQQQTKGMERYLATEASDNLSGLAQEMDEFVRSLPRDRLVSVLDHSGTVIASSGPASADLQRNLPELSPRGSFGTVILKRRSYRMFGELYAYNGFDYTLILAASTSTIDRTLHALSLLLLLAIPILVAVSGGGGYWLSRHALAPVDRMTASAQAIGFDNLSTRLDVPQTEDELQRLAETWNAMLARIEASVNRMKRFTADASHELRTPVAVIRTTAEVALRRDRDPESYRESLLNIGAETVRMTKLLEDLLFLARADSDPAAISGTSADLQLELRLAAGEIMPRALSKGVTVELENGACCAAVDGEPESIRRMFFALLDNAVKYTPPGGRVDASVCREGDRAVVRVHDSGIGITPQALPHIFERFFRADPSRQRDGESYGLGLAIAQTIAEQHNTRIEVASKPNSTVFSVGFDVAK